MRIVANSLALVLLAFPAGALAQANTTDEGGLTPFGSFSSGSLDTVNYVNGNVFIRVPLFSLPQLGKLSLSYSLVLNNKGYVGNVVQCEPDQCQNYVRSTGIGPVVVADQSLTTTFQPTLAPWSEGPVPYLLTWEITDPTTAITNLGWDSSNPTVARSMDGSGYTFVPTGTNYNWYALDNPPADSCWTAFYDGTLYKADGIKYTTNVACDANGGEDLLSTVMSDPNDNSITFNPGTYTWNGGVGTIVTPPSVTDSVGRNIPDFGYSAMSTPASNNCPNLGIAGQPATSSQTWAVRGPNNGTSSYLFCYTTVSYSTNFTGAGWQISPDSNVLYYTETYGQDTAIQSVVLPNGTYWGFVYDSSNGNYNPTYDPTGGSPPVTIAYGDLTKLILPTGGSITYSYTNAVSCPLALPNIVYDRFVSTRTTNDGNGNTATWQYTYSDPRDVYDGTPLVTTETDPNLDTTVHNFSSLSAQNQCDLVETSTNRYSGAATAGKTPMRSVSKTYYSNPLPHVITTTLETGISSAATYTYPPLFTPGAYACTSTTNCSSSTGSAVLFARPTSVVTTGYGLASSLTQETTYKWQNPTSGFLPNNWLTAVASTCTPNPGYTSCTPSTADTAAYTSFGYDPHGNVNSVSQWLSGTTPQYVTTSSVYTGQGMLSQTMDPMNNTTYYNYDPLGPGLYPSSVQRPTTGANNVPHTTYYSFAFNTGDILTQVDENGLSSTDPLHTTNYAYDAIGRLTDVKYPPVPAGSSSGPLVRPETQYCYTDLGGSLCSQGGPPFQSYVLTTATPNPTSLSMQQYDGLGRAITSTLLSDPEGALITSTTYDSLGRVATTTSPYRSIIDPTYDVVTYEYDSVGRRHRVTHSGDSSFTSWSYSGPSTTFTNALQNSTTRTVDALGRLTTVLDPAGLTTNYSYDTLGNLIKANQVGNAAAGELPRVRTFLYDSLSRPVCASNPETSSAPCSTSVTSAYVAGTTGYTYYPNGNVKSTTDAKGITASHTYDALNRLLGTTYSNDANSSPSSCYLYDGPSSGNFIGHIAQEWTQPYGSVCSSAPPPSDAITEVSVLSYDALGRVLSSQQCVLTMCNTGGTPFVVSQTFDLAGDLTSVTDPKGIQFYSTYDGAGRLRTIRSNWDDLTHPLHLFDIQSYSPAGPQTWMLGNSLNFQQTYDTRSRPTSQIVTVP